MTTATRSNPVQREMRMCAYCARLFPVKSPDNFYCSNKCRSNYHKDHGAEGRLVSVRNLANGGVSHVVHYAEGPAAQHAIKMKPSDLIRTVKEPRE